MLQVKSQFTLFLIHYFNPRFLICQKSCTNLYLCQAIYFSHTVFVFICYLTGYLMMYATLGNFLFDRWPGNMVNKKVRRKIMKEIHTYGRSFSKQLPHDGLGNTVQP